MTTISFHFLVLLALLVVAPTNAQLFECQDDGDCQNNGKCILVQGGELYCQCQPGFGGEDCSKPCDMECQNGGSCRFRLMGSVERTYCECPPHQFMGPKCETQFVVCPGLKEIKCFHGGTCQRQKHDYTCSCPEEWTGAFCQLEASDSSRQSDSSTNNTTDGVDDAGTIQDAMILLVAAIVGAGILTSIAMCFCRRQSTIDTKNEVDITSAQNEQVVQEENQVC